MHCEIQQQSRTGIDCKVVPSNPEDRRVSIQLGYLTVFLSTEEAMYLVRDLILSVIVAVSQENVELRDAKADLKNQLEFLQGLKQDAAKFASEHGCSRAED